MTGITAAMNGSVLLGVLLLWPIFGNGRAPASDWPMWRYDAGRTAASPAELPGELDLLWVREYSPREPVWDDPLNRDLMPYDEIFEPVVLGRRMFVPFNDSDKLVCLDVGTGAELWTFYADGPVRLPPAAWRGKVYFSSDDGCLYCLRADTGALVWKHEGAPSARKVLGNKRLISTWPARGGPVVEDGTVYYAASIWPFMGTFIYALDAETGDVSWLNDSTGAQYMKQPHNAPAFAGVAPQGAFVVAGEKLLIPGGRSVPACFDLETGRFLYYRLAANGKTGGSFVCALGEVFFNHHRERVTSMYDVETGGRLAGSVGNYPVLTEEAFFFSGQSVRAFDAKLLVSNPKKAGGAELWRLECDASGDLIKAGGRLYAAGGERVTAIDLARGEVGPTTSSQRRGRDPGKVAWTKSVGSQVGRLLAADGKLFAVTLDGKIMAFGRGPKRRPSRALTRRPRRPSGKARRILEGTRAREGYALVWGAATGEFLEALAAGSELRIVAVCPDAGTVDKMRRYLDARGLYGRRVAVHAGDPRTFGAPPYVASLSVIAGEAKLDRALLQSVYRSARPYGGVVWCDVGRAGAGAALRAARTGALEGARISQRPGAVVVTREGPLAGSAPWTHQYGDIANTVKSDDDLVKLPLGMLWFGGNSNMDVLPRHGHGPPEQVIGGRLFIEGIDLLSARDVYTGRVLWKAKLDRLGNYGVYYDKTYKDTPTSTSYNQVHIPGANIRGTNFVATDTLVYVAHGEEIRVLDAATGETIRDIPLPRRSRDHDVVPTTRRRAGGEKGPLWAYIGVYKDKLFGGAGFVPFSAVAPREEGEKRPAFTSFDHSASRGLVVMDRHTGRVKWSVSARSGFLHNGIVAGAALRQLAQGGVPSPSRGAGKVFCLDKVPPYVEGKLRRRGAAPPQAPASSRARLLALDVDSGRTVWETDENVFGTWLGYSEEHDVLIQTARPSRDMVRGEDIRRMIAYRGADGKVLWDRPNRYGGPAILHGDRIITAGAMWSLLTGERMTRRDPLTGRESEWVYKRAYGCNYNIGAEHILTFRSGAAGYYDLARDGGSGTFGGFKSGCTSNLVAADGVLNAPDYTRTCSCSYQNQTSLALVHDPEVEVWTTFAARRTPGPIRRVGINFGAPGDRRDEEGTYWVEHPLVGGPSPSVAVRVEGDDVGYFRMHSSRMAGGGPRWVAASGLEGAATIRVALGAPEGGIEEGGIPVAAGSDDAEESAAGGVNLGSSDLELVQESSRQVVGMRFAGVGLDRGERLKEAYVQFQVDEKSSGPAELVIRAEAADTAAGFSARARNISSRARTTASVKWRPEPWKEVGARGPRQRTPDVAPVIQEVLNRPGWKRGGAIVLIMTGSGKRVAESFDGDSNGAPRLVVRSATARRARDTKLIGLYTVRLHFAEPEDVRAGLRVFDVSIQGKKVLRRFDIVRAAGGVRTHVVKTFTGVRVVDAVEIRLEPCRPGAQKQPILGGVEARMER